MSLWKEVLALNIDSILWQNVYQNLEWWLSTMFLDSIRKLQVQQDQGPTWQVCDRAGGGRWFYWRRAAWCFRTMLVCPKLGPFLKSLRPTLLITIEDMLIEELLPHGNTRIFQVSSFFGGTGREDLTLAACSSSGGWLSFNTSFPSWNWRSSIFCRSPWAPCRRMPPSIARLGDGWTHPMDAEGLRNSLHWRSLSFRNGWRLVSNEGFVWFSYNVFRGSDGAHTHYDHYDMVSGSHVWNRSVATKGEFPVPMDCVVARFT